MKRTLLLFATFFSVAIGYTQITLNQVDDFEDGTELNWFEAAASGAQAENISTDGPAGADDNYLRDFTTQAPGGPGSRMIVRNTTQWIGDYTAEGVEAIVLDVRALSVDVTVRVSMTGAGGKFSSTTGVVVTAGTGWTQVTIPITASDMTAVSDGSGGGPGGTDVNATLADVTELRILSNPIASWIGEVTDAEMHMDNITAVGALSLDEFEPQNISFNISPNPSRDILNIELSKFSNDYTVEVFDVLGKRIFNSSLNQLKSSINVTNWKSGIYLVKVSNDNTTQTKRFIKQ